MSDKSSNTGAMRLIYSFIGVLGLVLLVAVLTGCGSTVAMTNGGPVPATVSAFSWDGAWASDPALMTADISNSVITINLENDGTTALYWKGTWPVDKAVSNGTVIVSDADVEALSASMFGSQDPTKAFTFNNGELTFKFSIMGVTQTIHLQKG